MVVDVTGKSARRIPGTEARTDPPSVCVKTVVPLTLYRSVTVSEALIVSVYPIRNRMIEPTAWDAEYVKLPTADPVVIGVSVAVLLTVMEPVIENLHPLAGCASLNQHVLNGNRVVPRSQPVLFPLILTIAVSPIKHEFAMLLLAALPIAIASVVDATAVCPSAIEFAPEALVDGPTATPDAPPLELADPMETEEAVDAFAPFPNATALFAAEPVAVALKPMATPWVAFALAPTATELSVPAVDVADAD
jgi:hypothetical protein